MKVCLSDMSIALSAFFWFLFAWNTFSYIWSGSRKLNAPTKRHRLAEMDQMEISPNIHWKHWCWSSNTLATSCEELTHMKRPWCWERLKAGGEGDNRGWDRWMVSPTQWTWVCINSGSWWWTGRPCMLWFMGSQRVRHDWVTELNCCQSLLLRSGVLWCDAQDPLSLQCTGVLLPSTGPQACGLQSLVLTGFSDCSLQAPEWGLSSCGTWAELTHARGIFLEQGSTLCCLPWQSVLNHSPPREPLLSLLD